MQQELVDLQPKLIQTSKETAELIEFISKESIEVEAVKKVVEADEVVANNAAMDAKAIKVAHGQIQRKKREAESFWFRITTGKNFTASLFIVCLIFGFERFLISFL